MKTIIIEDEKLAAERLEELIHEIDSSIEISAKLHIGRAVHKIFKAK